MEMLGFVCVIIAILISVVYGIILLIRAFQVSLLWGLACLFLPFVQLFFIVVHWQVAKDPFLKSLIAIPFLIIGMLLMPEGTLEQYAP